MSMPTPTRRLKWNPAPPPPHCPNVIHLPIRRLRKENCKPTGEKSSHCRDQLHGEREFSSGGVVPIVVLNSASCGHRRRERAEEKWMVRAEMWRAECDLLRVERESALKKVEKNRARMEATLRTAVQALIAGKNKISEGRKEDADVVREIEELAEKLEELRRSCKRDWDSEIKSCSKKLSGWGCEKGLRNPQHLSETNLLINNNGSRNENKSTHVRIKRELDGRETEEQPGSTNSSTANSSIPSSASSPNRMEFSITQKPHQEEEEEEALRVRPVEEENKCSGRCRAVVQKIIEQVRAESDQWSQMQEMLGRVRDEMQHLQSSRDYWEHRSRRSSTHIQFLHSMVQEWKERAQSSEAKAKEMEKQLSAALEKLRATSQGTLLHSNEAITKPTQISPKLSFCKHVEKEELAPTPHAKKDTHTVQAHDDTAERRTPQISLAMQIEKEKRRRSPFRDVVNSTHSLLGGRRNNLADGLTLLSKTNAEIFAA